MKVQWLLIGGSMNGQTHWADNAPSVFFPRQGNTAEVEAYRGLTYHRRGKRYRIGLASHRDFEASKIESLILKVQPQPMGEL
jgi:hypothetical protein